MTTASRTLFLLPETYAICHLEPHEAIPDWALIRTANFFTITHTQEELSIICPQQQVPDDVTAHRDWRCFKLQGPFDLDEPGILAGIVTPLAQAGIAVFAEATYDTDYLLVNKVEAAIAAFEKMNHRVLEYVDNVN
jgi:uncharacterized protein